MLPRYIDTVTSDQGIGAALVMASLWWFDSLALASSVVGLVGGETHFRFTDLRWTLAEEGNRRGDSKD